QWLNSTSNGKILQLSHSLNSEAPEGTYSVIVTINERELRHSFKVEKYVLPKFDVNVKAPDEISIAHEEIQVEVCAKYTYGQPVPGSVELQVCRPLRRHAHVPRISTPEHPEGIPEVTAPCHSEMMQTEKSGCATFTIQMSAFKDAEKILQDKLNLRVKMEEEGTGITGSQSKSIEISYVVGRLSFIDTPKVYEEGSVVEGKVKAVYYNNTPIAHALVYLMMGEQWSARPLQNLTTDSEGIAAFSLNTTSHKANIQLTVRLTHISIHYTIAGETEGHVDLMYLILARGAIVMLGHENVEVKGHENVEVKGDPVAEGDVVFDLKVSPDMAPEVQVVAYAVLPSLTVIAHSADFPTEKCFSNKVSVEFFPPSAVPGEGSTLQLTALPDSLCGVSVVDQSVLIKQPKKILDADQVINRLTDVG
ncbi:hypothetical protein LDENG_00209080, partial [Lucifuga dentata]